MSETRVKPVYLSQEEVLNALPEKIGNVRLIDNIALGN